MTARNGFECDLCLRREWYERDVEQLQASLRFTVDQGERREKELHEHRRKMLAEQRAQLDAFGRFGRKVVAWLYNRPARKTVKVADLTAMAVECGVEGLER